MLPAERARERRLQTYLLQNVMAAQDEIAPELLDYICGEDEASIDRSIETAKRKSAELVARARGGQMAAPSDVVPQWQQANVREGYGDPQVDIVEMDMRQFAEYRQQIGLSQNDVIAFLGGGQ